MCRMVVKTADEPRNLYAVFGCVRHVPLATQHDTLNALVIKAVNSLSNGQTMAASMRFLSTHAQVSAMLKAWTLACTSHARNNDKPPTVSCRLHCTGQGRSWKDEAQYQDSF